MLKFLFAVVGKYHGKVILGDGITHNGVIKLIIAEMGVIVVNSQF